MKNKFGEYVVDVESDGQCPGIYNMISLGCVNVRTFKGFQILLQPDVQNNGGIPEARNVSKISWEHQILNGVEPKEAMLKFKEWLDSDSTPESRKIFWSDNNGFDWQFINYYFHKYLGENPFGHSSRRIGDLYAGHMQERNSHSKWKSLRDTTHSHNPLDDATGNAEALSKIFNKIKLSHKYN